MPKRRNLNSNEKRRRIECHRVLTFTSYNNVNKLDNMMNDRLERLEKEHKSLEIVNITFRTAVVKEENCTVESRLQYSAQIHYKYTNYIKRDGSECEEDCEEDEECI